MRGNITIKNTSAYPDEWVKAVIVWLSHELKYRKGGTYRIDVKNTSRGHHGHASIGAGRAVIHCQRRGNWRKDCSYARREDRGTYTANTPLESFVWIAAHEMIHMSPEGFRVYNDCLSLKRNGDFGGHRWRDRMEITTQTMTAQLLDKYRNGIRERLLSRYKECLTRARERESMMREKRMAIKSPDARLGRIEEQYAAWDAKKRRAEKALTKLRRRRSGILSAQKRAASKGGAA